MTQCIAKTVKGTQCERQAVKGGVYCKQHSQQKMMRIFLRTTVILGFIGFIANITGILDYIGITIPSSSRVVTERLDTLQTQQAQLLTQSPSNQSLISTTTAIAEEIVELESSVDTKTIRLPGKHRACPELSSEFFLQPTLPSITQRGLVTATPSNIRQAIRIQIPSISVDAAIVQGDSWERLKQGVGQQKGTVYAGERGVIVLSAFDDIYGELFRDVDKLRAGDQVKIFSSERQYIYTVEETYIIDSSEFEYTYSYMRPVLILTSQ